MNPLEAVLTKFRKFRKGKPNPYLLASHWYWFDEAFWHQQHLDLGGKAIPDFDFPFTDEDIEMTDRINHYMAKNVKGFKDVVVDRAQLVRTKRIQNFGGWRVYYPFWTSNPNDARFCIPFYVTISTEMTEIAKTIEEIALKFGERVTAEEFLLERFKDWKHAIMFAEKPLSYYSKVAKSYNGDFLSYKVDGKREEIRQEFFHYLCTRDVNSVVNRIALGEKAWLITLDIYFAMEDSLLECRMKDKYLKV